MVVIIHTHDYWCSSLIETSTKHSCFRLRPNHIISVLQVEDLPLSFWLDFYNYTYEPYNGRYLRTVLDPPILLQRFLESTGPKPIPNKITKAGELLKFDPIDFPKMQYWHFATMSKGDSIRPSWLIRMFYRVSGRTRLVANELSKKPNKILLKPEPEKTFHVPPHGHELFL